MDQFNQAPAPTQEEFEELKIKDLVLATKNGTTNANGIIWLDEDYRETIVVGACCIYYPMSFGYDPSNYKYFACVMNIQNGTMVPFSNQSTTIRYYKVSRT